MNLYDDKTHALIELPAERKTFRGHDVTVLRITHYSGGGSSGKVETADGRTYFPGVVGAYIAPEPKAAA